jgi:hypothetical protein
MESLKYKILESLKRAGRIDEESYQIITAFPEPGIDSTKYQRKMNSLIASGLTEKQLLQITTVDLMLILGIDDANAYVEIYNGIYPRLKETLEVESKLKRKK